MTWLDRLNGTTWRGMYRKGGGGGTTVVEAPKPSEEELALQREQTALLRDQRAIIQQQVEQQKFLAPFLFRESGLEPILNESGDIVGFEEIEPTEQERLQEEIELGFLQRSQKALAGELEISPGLERELGEQEVVLRERLRQQLGSGFETSTPGIEALSRFETQTTELRESARRGELSLSEQFGLARSGQQQQQLQQFIGNTLGIAGGQSENIAQLGQVGQGFGQQIGQFERQRQAELQARLGSVRQSAGGSGLGAAGIGAAGSIIGGALSFFSSRTVKTAGRPVDPENALEIINRLPIEVWEYLSEEYGPVGQQIGTYSEDFQKETGIGNGLEIPVVSAVGLMMAAIQGLSKQVEELKEKSNATSS